jgi:hypothetical protein
MIQSTEPPPHIFLLSSQPAPKSDGSTIDNLREANQALSNMLKKERVKTTRLRKKIKEFCVYKCDKKNLTHHLKKHVKGSALEILSNELQNADRTPKRRRYTDDVKLICLAIRYQSPKAYRFLRKIFALPSVSTLTRLTRGFT